MASTGEVLGGKTLFVRNLPINCTNEQLEQVFSDIGPTKQCFVVRDRETSKSRGFGYVKFSLREDAEKAISQSHTIDANKLHVVFAKSKLKEKKRRKPDEDPEQEEIKVKEEKKIVHPVKTYTPKYKKRNEDLEAKRKLKKARVIVRNLSFKCDENTLKEYFSKYGNVNEVTIPRRDKGLKLGCGFVQFADMHGANRAMQVATGQKILGRPVAVDWAVPKNVFISHQNSLKSNETADHSDDDDVSDDDDDDDSDHSGDQVHDNSEDNKSTESAESEEDEDKMSSGDSDMSEESMSDDDSIASESDNSDDESTRQKKVLVNTKNKRPIKSDIEEGRTLFIRNISYDTLNDDLEETFEDFGELNYCRIVVDPATEHSKGVGFVQFKRKEDADNCLELANSQKKDGGIELDKRKLSVVLAVDKNKAKELKTTDKPKKEKVDKRNLHLARVGLIRPGTQGAEGLSKDDLGKRMKVETIKRQKLKNCNIFISPTRLCIRNIPIKVDDKELKKAFLKAISQKNAKIRECRIMRDQTQINSNGIAKSRGFGFVEFTEHDHALHALEHTNNNPDIFGEKRRLIVEFSLENKAALEAKQKRLERYQTRQGALKSKNIQSVKQKNKNTKSPVIQVAPRSDKDKKLPKGLPSHWGPKVRHKPRGPTKLEEKKVKGGKQTNTKSSESKADPKKKKTRGKRERERSDDFDKLVNKYRNNLMQAGVSTAAKRSKWFE